MEELLGRREKGEKSFACLLVARSDAFHFAQQFQAKAEEDKQRYQREREAYGPDKAQDSSDEGRARKRRKKKRDPNMPKRAMTAYMLYSQDNRARVVAANPGEKHTAMFGLLSKEWKAAPADVRQVQAIWLSSLDSLAKRTVVAQ